MTEQNEPPEEDLEEKREEWAEAVVGSEGGASSYGSPRRTEVRHETKPDEKRRAGRDS